MKYGKHTNLVEAFLTHIKSGKVDWDGVQDVSDANLDDAWNAAFDAVACARGARDAWDAWSHAFDAAFDAAWDAVVGAASPWDAAGQAAYEIVGHEVLAERGQPLVFLPMFGIESIEQLKEMAK